MIVAVEATRILGLEPALLISLITACLALVGGIWAARIASRATTSSAHDAANATREANRTAAQAAEADRRWREMEHLYELVKASAAEAQAGRDEFRRQLDDCERRGQQWTVDRLTLEARLGHVESENANLRTRLNLPEVGVDLTRHQAGEQQ